MTPLQFKLLRVALGMSQRAFAAHLGVSRQSVSNWERGVWPLPAEVVLRLQAEA